MSSGSLFKRQAAPLLGIDISSSSAKLVELGRNKNGQWVLERCAIEPLERGWIVDGNVEKFDEVAEAAGLKPVVLDIESYAARLAAARLLETLPAQGVGAVVALFKIGGAASGLQVIRNDEVLYEREQAFGGGQLTQLIVRQYGFSPEEAETKKRHAELPDDYDTAVLRPFVDNMAAEVVRALQFFFTSTPYNRVDHVMLAGGSASLPGLAEAVARQSGFACSLANPFEGMEVGSSVRAKKAVQQSASYLTACGLAMRRFLQ